MASSRSDEQPRAFDVVDSDVTESESIRRQIKQTRERLSAVLAHHAHLREEMQCIASEEEYLCDEARRIDGRIREERQPYVKTALEQAMREIFDDIMRLRSESEIVIAAVDDLRVEKAALNAALVQQTLAILDSRQSDILRIAEGTGQSHDEATLLRFRETLSGPNGGAAAQHLWALVETQLKEQVDAQTQLTPALSNGS